MFSKRPLFSVDIPKDILTILTSRGYETVEDLSSVDPDELSKDINIALQQAEDIIHRCKETHISTSASKPASMFKQSATIKTQFPGLDAILDGGLKRGRILEISGPPGSPKEKILIEIARSFPEEEGVLFVDCENMTGPATLIKDLQHRKSRVRYIRISCLPQFLLFLHQLLEILNSSNCSLLAINSISYLFQSPDAVSRKGYYLDYMKSCFAKLCAVEELTIVTTSQLSTKMINSDGTRGSFDSGARGIMLPQLGPSYLPSTKSYRVLLWPNDPVTGTIKLLSSPKFPPGKVPPVVCDYSIAQDRGNEAPSATE